MTETTITKLISLKQEGGYWDFKQRWYDSGSRLNDLLIDIICMANNLENHEAYIIIGVDEGNDYSLVTCENDTNRKNTQNIVDFLKDKSFAGGIRPLAKVETLIIDGTVIDVIVIENSPNTPFMLTSDYRDIKAHHVYTRIHDVNTARNNSADIDKVEHLYRKRFRISEAPFERFEYYLHDMNGWAELHGQSGYEFYYQHASDQFTIRFKSGSEDERCEFWSLMFPDSGRHNDLDAIEITWNGLVLSNEYQYAPLDGARSYCIMPQLGRIQFENENYRYFYLIKGTVRYLLYEFIWAKLQHNDAARYRGSIEKHFIIFDDIEQSKRFQQTIEQQKEVISELLDAERVSPENAHLSSEGFYYGFNELDIKDYVDSAFFVSKYEEIINEAE